jgi:hypothetical protein
MGPVQMSNKLNNLIIIMNINLCNLNIILTMISINNSIYLSNETCIV